MTGLTDRLGMRIPVVAAPMAGGATTPALAAAAARAGAYPMLPAGYKTPEALAAAVAGLRADVDRFGVNLFSPNPVPIDPQAYAAYASTLTADARRFGVDLPRDPVEDDDHWAAKLDLLLSDPPELVSFTFGLPPASAVAALRRRGALLAQTVTTPGEAVAAEEAGMDALVVQSAHAGGHSGAFDPARLGAALPLPALVAAVRAVSGLPVIGGGGVAGPEDAAAALEAGAEAVAVGTLLLRADESGASATHRAALADPRFDRTAVTRAFTGRPARGLVNAFLTEHGDAPLGYPALHHLTAGLRRAAAAAGDADRLHLWAGTGFRAAEEAPAARILAALSALA